MKMIFHPSSNEIRDESSHIVVVSCSIAFGSIHFPLVFFFVGVSADFSLLYPCSYGAWRSCAKRSIWLWLVECVTRWAELKYTLLSKGYTNDSFHASSPHSKWFHFWGEHNWKISYFIKRDNENVCYQQVVGFV